MRTIIAGSRSLTDPAFIEAAVKASGFVITTVLSGTARGIDRLGEAWAKTQGLPVELYPADWEQQGKAAGMLRNRLMVSKADALIDFIRERVVDQDFHDDRLAEVLAHLQADEAAEEIGRTAGGKGALVSRWEKGGE